MTVEKLLKRYPDAILIKDWQELHTLIPQESDTHILKLEVQDNGEIWGGGIRCKNPRPYDGGVNWAKQRKYMSYLVLTTHTFYGGKINNFAESTFKLQECGFNVVLDSWG
jgi:hypothetical protein